MSEAARIPNHITHVVLHGGNDDNNPMNHTIAHSGFLSLADFMTYTRDNLNNLGPITLSHVQKNCIMNL